MTTTLSVTVRDRNGAYTTGRVRGHQVSSTVSARDAVARLGARLMTHGVIGEARIEEDPMPRLRPQPGDHYWLIHGQEPSSHQPEPMTKTTTTELATTSAPAATVTALASQLRYEGATDPATLENSARECVRRASMAIFELGGYLLMLREACPHGQFLPALERLGVEPRSAQRYMRVTARFAGSKSDTVSHLQALGVRKLLDLTVLDDEQIDELAEQGQTGELKLDDVATMSVAELRAAVREERQERKALEDLSAEKSKHIDKLRTQVKRIQDAPPDEVLADLKREASAIANQAQGHILGNLRRAVAQIIEHADQHDQHGAHAVFLAGLVGQVQATLTAVRTEFALADVSATAALPDWMDEQYADRPGAADAANGQPGAQG
jgi:hypothetical protein